MNQKIVDHLFRHQYGKMTAILTKFFGLSHIELIEDAVQDTFIKATLQWRTRLPENPEAWLFQATRNRIIDLLRQGKAEKSRYGKFLTGPATIQLNDLFLAHEVEDSQLRMIFVACHPFLSAEEQIAFALKTISGFSMKEIAAALLLKKETIKKRLSRSRKTIVEKNIQFDYPAPNEIHQRMAGVLQVIYLIFNEGFNSTKPDQLISKDLCGEALRLCKLLLKKKNFRSGSLYALFALMCFHSSRLESKIGPDNEIVDLEHQDRSRWYRPLIALGNDAMIKSLEYQDTSAYHLEAEIAFEHVNASRFKETNWKKILELYKQLQSLQPSDSNLMSMAIIHLQLNNLVESKKLLDSVNEKNLEHRSYLLFGCYADYYLKKGDFEKSIKFIGKAITLATNESEKNYIVMKRSLLLSRN